jgi:hypothetical protein
MHDGYVYTFALTNAVDGPAAQLLNEALATLPPVKRAAYVPVVTDEAAAAIADELRDAELLILAAAGNTRPIDAWAAAALSRSAAPVTGLAVVFGWGISSDDLQLLTGRLVRGGLQIAHAQLHDGPPDAAFHSMLRRVYAAARQRCSLPPLPHDWTAEEE